MSGPFLPHDQCDLLRRNATNFTNTLGQNFAINSLTFTGSNGSNAVNIAADGNILTVGSGGVMVQSGAGPVTLGVNLAGTASVTDNNSAYPRPARDQQLYRQHEHQCRHRPDQ